LADLKATDNCAMSDKTAGVTGAAMGASVEDMAANIAIAVATRRLISVGVME
jgi:Ca2+/Na+ antiporter